MTAQNGGDAARTRGHFWRGVGGIVLGIAMTVVMTTEPDRSAHTPEGALICPLAVGGLHHPPCPGRPR